MQCVGIIKLQVANTLFEKTPLPCHEAYSAGARSALMRMRTSCIHVRISIFGTPGSPSTKTNSWNKYKSFHEMIFILVNIEMKGGICVG